MFLLISESLILCYYSKIVRNVYKEVKIKLEMKVKKEVLLDIIISSLAAGKYPSQIAREQKISKQKVSYYIRKLKDEGLIRKIGYGVWELNFDSTKVGHSVRGHSFMWKIKLPKQYNWEKILKSKNINYKLIGLKETPRIIYKERKIWLGKKNLIVYEPESFFGFNSIESKKLAIYRLLKLLTTLENKLGTTFKQEEGYLFKVARQHYSLIKNSLAIQCNETGQKIQVYNRKGLWFLVDNSYNLEEAETVHPESSLIDNLGIQKYFNSHKDTGFKVTPEFVLKGFDNILKIQNVHAQNIVKHQKVLDEMLVTLRKIQESLDK